jgi:protein-tyrosine phosphatase
MVHCSGGKGRTETILAAYLIKKRNVLNAYRAIKNLRKIRGESIQSKDQRIFFSATKNRRLDLSNLPNSRSTL